jgi:nucleoside-diphosphate-sugar epimerase
MAKGRLAIIGLGYSGAAVARLAVAEGWEVVATSRNPAAVRAPAGVAVVPFGPAALAGASHVLMTAAPGPEGDPVLPAMAAAITAGWAGYLSTTGVYGDRGGGWVDEDTLPAPAPGRSQRRLEAEQAWAALGGRMAVDIFRVAGIYGPGRSALEEVQAGRARRIDKPGHAFGRIHRDDIARAVLAALGQSGGGQSGGGQRRTGQRVLHLADDLPAENAAVVAEAARLLGAPPPPLVPFAEAWAGMGEMARSFWAENRRVANAKTKAALGIGWRYPTFREGLAGILAEQAGHRAAEQSEV